MSIAPVTQTAPNLLSIATTDQGGASTAAPAKTIISQTSKTSASGVVTTTITYSDGTTQITVSGGDAVSISGKKAA